MWKPIERKSVANEIYLLILQLNIINYCSYPDYLYYLIVGCTLSFFYQRPHTYFTMLTFVLSFKYSPIKNIH